MRNTSWNNNTILIDCKAGIIASFAVDLLFVPLYTEHNTWGDWPSVLSVFSFLKISGTGLTEYITYGWKVFCPLSQADMAHSVARLHTLCCTLDPGFKHVCKHVDQKGFAAMLAVRSSSMSHQGFACFADLCANSWAPWLHFSQGCIPVDCVPPAHLLACRLLAGNKGSGVCLFTTMQKSITEWQTPVKT